MFCILYAKYPKTRRPLEPWAIAVNEGYGGHGSSISNKMDNIFGEKWFQTYSNYINGDSEEETWGEFAKNPRSDFVFEDIKGTYKLAYMNEKGELVSSIQSSIQTSQSGVQCSNCKTINEYGSPNQTDGSYLCYNCR